MAEWKRKLHSQSGASLLFALLFFLVASMVGIVVLDAAVTTSKRLTDDVHWEQDYLALTSAARLFRQTLADSSCTAEIVDVYTGGAPAASEDGERTPASLDHTEYLVQADGPLKELLEYLARQVFNESAFSALHNDSPPKAASVEKAFTISAGEGQPVVNVKLTMTGYNDKGSDAGANSFHMTADFWCGGDGWTVQHLYLTADPENASNQGAKDERDGDGNGRNTTASYELKWSGAALSVNIRK